MLTDADTACRAITAFRTEVTAPLPSPILSVFSLLVAPELSLRQTNSWCSSVLVLPGFLSARTPTSAAEQQRAPSQVCCCVCVVNGYVTGLSCPDGGE